MNVIEKAIASRIRKADDMNEETEKFRVRIFYPNKSINPENAIENFLNRNERDGFGDHRVQYKDCYIAIISTKKVTDHESE